MLNRPFNTVWPVQPVYSVLSKDSQNIKTSHTMVRHFPHKLCHSFPLPWWRHVTNILEIPWLCLVGPASRHILSAFHKRLHLIFGILFFSRAKIIANIIFSFSVSNGINSSAFRSSQLFSSPFLSSWFQSDAMRSKSGVNLRYTTHRPRKSQAPLCSSVNVRFVLPLSYVTNLKPAWTSNLSNKIHRFSNNLHVLGLIVTLFSLVSRALSARGNVLLWVTWKITISLRYISANCHLAAYIHFSF